MRNGIFRYFSVAILALSLLGSNAWSSSHSSRYSVDNGTVIDSVTGLTWIQDTSHTSWAYDYESAAQHCDDQNYYRGETGWRLPKIYELATIQSPRYEEPNGYLLYALYAIGDPYGRNGLFWSSTSYAPDPSRFWAVDFYADRISSFDQWELHSVRCVRSP